MKKTLLFATILAMATFSSCSKDEVVDVNRNSDKMSFGAHIGSATKAIVTDATNFTDYNLYGYQTTGDYTGTAPLTDCYINNEAFTKKDGSWTHDNEFYWSTDANEKMQFFGVTPATAINAEGNYPKFSYTIKANIAEQEDFMVSALLNQTKPANDEKITLDFKHILSQVNFTLKGESAGFKYTVTKIELLNVNSNGKFTFNTEASLGAWSEQKTLLGCAIDLSSNNIVEGTTPLRVENNIMMLLPQTLPAEAKIKVTYSVTQGDRTSKIFDGSKEISIANKVWAKNTRTRYTLTLPVGGDKMEFDTNVSDWEAEIPEVLSILELKPTTTINSGATETLIPNLIPSNAGATYEWVSSDVNIATVANGVVTANATTEGTATITATAKVDGNVIATATCVVAVTDPNNVAINIPDAAFRAYLLGNAAINTNSDDKITVGEAKAFTSTIKITDPAVSDLTGLEHFTALTSLWYSGTQIASLDVSANTDLISLLCNNTQISSLDVSKNTALTDLYCNNTQISSLDVSKNTALTNLRCNNTQISSLDVSKNTALTNLHCNDTQISSLDVSKNTALTYLACGATQIISLDVSANTALTYLACGATQIISLDVSANTALTYLACYGTQITSLDVSTNTALKNLYCSNCPNLVNSSISGKLDLSNNTLLTSFQILNTPGITELLVWSPFTQPSDWHGTDGKKITPVVNP